MQMLCLLSLRKHFYAAFYERLDGSPSDVNIF